MSLPARDALSNIPENVRGHLSILEIVQKKGEKLSLCDLSFLDEQSADIKNLYVNAALSIRDYNAAEGYPKKNSSALLLSLKGHEKHNGDYSILGLFKERGESITACMDR